jgi:6-phosphogluconolactonase
MKPARGSLKVFADAEALAHGAAVWLAERAARSTGRFRLCLSGGSTPKQLYTDLATDPLRAQFPWERTQFLFGDERFVPPDDPASNFRMAREAMFSRAPVPPDNIHAMPTTGVTPDQAAERYEQVLQKLYGGASFAPDRPLFDVTFLGLGEDGHTASLIPGEPVLQDRTHWVGVVAHGRPETRLTLTYPAIESSAAIVFLVQGSSKTAILDRVLSGDESVPAGHLRGSGELFWFADREAAGRWAD